MTAALGPADAPGGNVAPRREGRRPNAAEGDGHGRWCGHRHGSIPCVPMVPRSIRSGGE